ncbi:MAG: recombinase family protein [Acidobacteria bacterium]|nr:recombinase family protein [Acidobacteriota bacterium]
MPALVGRCVQVGVKAVSSSFEVDVVLVWRFDRFARSTKHLILALKEFRNPGIDFVSYQENIDTSSPLGSAIFTIISAVACIWAIWDCLY